MEGSLPILPNPLMATLSFFSAETTPFLDPAEAALCIEKVNYQLATSTAEL
jgi:hypothetical protein